MEFEHHFIQFSWYGTIITGTSAARSTVGGLLVNISFSETFQKKFLSILFVKNSKIQQAM